MTNFNKEKLLHSVQEDHLLLKGMFFTIVPGRIESCNAFALSKDTIILACLQNSRNQKNSLLFFFGIATYSHCVCI